MRTLPLPQPSRKRPTTPSDPKLKIGSSFCRCSPCGEYFKSERAFARHRVGAFDRPGDRGCAPTPRMPELGLRLTAGIWRLRERAFHGTRRDACHDVGHDARRRDHDGFSSRHRSREAAA